MTNPYWPPPKTRAPKSRFVAAFVCGLLQLAACICGFQLGGGFQQNGPLRGAEPIVGMLIGGAIWWCWCVCWWRPACPACRSQMRCKPRFRMATRGTYVTLTFGCEACSYRYPMDQEEEQRDLKHLLMWTVGMAHSLMGVIFAVAGISMAVFSAVPKRDWGGAMFCIVFSAMGCGWVMLVKFGMQWLRRRSEESLQVSQQDSFKGTLDVDGQ